MAREDNFWIGLEVRRRRGFTDNTGEWCGAWWDKEREGVDVVGTVSVRGLGVGDLKRCGDVS